jgi:hypothetical protein
LPLGLGIPAVIRSLSSTQASNSNIGCDKSVRNANIA